MPRAIKQLIVLTDDTAKYSSIVFSDMHEVARYFQDAADSGQKITELDGLRFSQCFRLVDGDAAEMQ